jgi:hypothetical protein
MSLKPIQRSAEFTEILGIIQAGRAMAFEAVNVALIETYWSIGEQLSRKVTEADWGKGIVKELADWLGKQAPDLKGLDLLFFHRDLQCLVAFELKTGRFEPEHMGKLAFYLEALDRDRKPPHENPSIGVLLCRTKMTRSSNMP